MGDNLFNVEALIALFGGLAVVFAIFAVVLALSILVSWFFFRKMGEPGWKIFIPFYNTYVIFKRCWTAGKYWKYLVLSIIAGVLSALVPSVDFILVSLGSGLISLELIINLVIYLVYLIVSIILLVMQIKLYLRISYSFNRRVLFGFGLLILPIIFFPILAFGRPKYAGPFKY